MSEHAGEKIIDGRKAYTFIIEFDDGRTKQATIIQGRVKLKTMKLLDKAQKSGDWEEMIPVFAQMLKITPEEVEEIEMWQWEEMGTYLRSAGEIPNASAPTIE